MFFDNSSVFAYAISLIVVLIICRIFIKPIKWILRFALNGIFGALILAAVNFAGGFAGIYVIISPIAAAIAGTLGVPGVLLVIVLQYLL